MNAPIGVIYGRRTISKKCQHKNRHIRSTDIGDVIMCKDCSAILDEDIMENKDNGSF